MNINVTAKYLQFLRKSHDYTQEDLAKKLDISRQAVSKWETGTAIPDLEVLLVLKQFDANSLVTALMGASPETNSFCERLFPDIDFEMTRKNIGRIRIETVEDMQNQIIAMLNMQAVDKEI